MALTDKLTAIGNAIREKTGGTDLLTLDQMPTEISNIQGGGTVEELTITSNGTYNPPTGIDGYAPVVVNVPQDSSPPESAFNITGDCSYRFANNGWDWFIEMYGNQITTNNISKALSMFNKSSVSSIPFELNYNNSITPNFENMFAYCQNLIKAPRINISNANDKIPKISSMFYECNRLVDIDYDYFSHWYSEEKWETISNNNDWSYTQTFSNLFERCCSLRKHPDVSMINTTSPYDMSYTRVFHCCYCLDEILDFPVWKASLTNNEFRNPFYWNFRLKNLTFKTNSDGTPKTANWSNQTINLTEYIGYIDIFQHDNYIKTYGSATGITEDKKVSDDATYQALKDDPNWYAFGINYSRYNHNSAVETINSLPDVSGGSGNTIKFKGASGALTDGGAINTLTAEEIAVATAKGWSVALV